MAAEQYIYPPKINWAQIMADLKDAGCSVYGVAGIIGAAYCTAQNWSKGGEPGHGYGEALLRLHSRVCGDELTKRRCNEGEQST